jgi:hypothetical protein
VAVRFTPDHAGLILVHPHPAPKIDGRVDSLARYSRLGHTRHSIDVVRRGETDLNADSTPIVWDLMLRSPNTYAWHRSDWRSTAFTHELRRCPS